MNDLNELKRIIEEKGDFIKNPMDLIYETLDDYSADSVKEALVLIINHNKKLLETLRKENLSLENMFVYSKEPEESVKVFEPEMNEIVSAISTEPKRLNVQDKLEKLFYTTNDNDFINFVKNISQEELLYIKLEILKRIKKIEEELKKSIVFNPTEDVLELQDKLIRFRIILQNIDLKEEKEDEVVEVIDQSKILILPNKKNNSYLFEDILEYSNKSKEIKIAFDKIVSGYFLKTKDTEHIQGQIEKLYEYKNKKTGLRVMYMVLPNDYVIITSLFYKDKTKSVKIESYYEEAIRRFNLFKDYIYNNIQNPDFYIEQAEYIGSIYDLLEKTKSNEIGKE